MRQTHPHFIFVAFLFCLYSCSEPGNRGLVKVSFADSQYLKMKGKHLYLVSNRSVIDSAMVNTKNLTLDPTRRPIDYSALYSVQYYSNQNGNTYLRPIGFKAPEMKENFIFSYFLIEDQPIEIGELKWEDFQIGTFRGSTRNKPYFKQHLLSFPDTTDLAIRQKIISNNKKLIERYPGNGWLLKSLYTFRNMFTEDELKSQVKLFEQNKETRTILGDFEAYYPFAGPINSIFPAGAKVTNSKGDTLRLNNPSDKQIIVFWASWCGPCRQEIPTLKRLYNKYGGSGLSIASISIDDDADAWNLAMEQEQMPWQQFLVNEELRKGMERFVTLNSIPKNMVFDGHGKLIKLIEGNSEELTATVDSLYKGRQ